jgi:DNA-binding response OmpR family regulator
MCDSANPRILYVDDDRDSCELMGLMLKMSNDSYEVTAVSTARKAVDLMENQPVALLILDYALPETTGVELCRKIRENDSNTPILFYSAMGREVDRQEAFAAGATEYLVKPNDLDRLTETVQRLLSQNSSVSESTSSMRTKAYDRIF